MSTYKKYIKHLIEEEINQFLQEQDLPTQTPEPDLGTEAPTEDLGGSDTASDLEVDAGGGGEIPDLGAGGEGLDGAGEVEGEGLEGEEGFGAEGGGFAGGFSGGGGGFSFDSGGEPGLSPDDEKEAETATTVGPEDVEMPDDPIMAIADEAISMLATTRQPNIILKSVKSSIQRYFHDFEDATPVIKALWDTEDVILKDVARRLLLFIRGI